MRHLKTEIKDWFTTNYPEIHEQMQNCFHTHSNGTPNPFHLENDAWSHTEMVLDLCREDVNHIFAALLHDIGKIDTRYEKGNGRVSFYYHENVSMVKSIDILKKASRYFRFNPLLILQLVAWHGTLWDKTPIKDKIPTLNDRYGHQPDVLNELIAFVEADAYGRDYDLSIQCDLDHIDNQLGHLYNFIPYNSQKYKKRGDLEAIFMVGISGSGKSTYISNHLDIDQYRVISVDNYFNKKGKYSDHMDYKKNIKKAHDQSIKDLLDGVQERQNILVDMTNLSKDIRRKKLMKIPSTQYTTKAVVFLTGEKKIYENLEKRDHRKLSRDIIEKQITQFELPNHDEFDDIVYLWN